MLCYYQSGSIESPAVVFLHGFLGCKEDWHPITNALQDTHFCTALDLVGHGCSPHSGEMIPLILETLDFLKIDRCSLVGYSMGGRIAMALDHLFPSRFSPLLLISANPGIQSDRERSDRLEKDLAWAKMLEGQPIQKFLEQWYAQPLFDSLRSNKELYEKIFKQRMRQNPKVLSRILKEESLAKQPLYQPEKAIYICGSNDQKFLNLYRDYNPIVIPNCGHAPHIENPSACKEAIYANISMERRGNLQ